MTRSGNILHPATSRRLTGGRPATASRHLASATAVLLSALLLAGCGGGPPAAAHRAPPLVVATAMYPLAQAVDLIGQGAARAIDLVPPGADPFSFAPDASEMATARRANLVVLAGPSVQPAFYQAARFLKTAFDASGAATEPYFWLDPEGMRPVVGALAEAMKDADPANAAKFSAGAHALQVELDSTAIDYQSTLSTCPRRTVFAANDAFAAMARRYDLEYHALGTASSPPASLIRNEALSVSAAGATAVFDETWVSSKTVRAVASAAKVKVRSLDTLAGPPPGGWPRQATYLNLLEFNLGQLSGALGCAGTGSGG